MRVRSLVQTNTRGATKEEKATSIKGNRVREKDIHT